MLSHQNKLDIYGLLCQDFTKNKEYPLSQVALYLKTQGLSYGEYGYKKMKSLLGDLKEFLTLKSIDSKDHTRKEELVILHDYQDSSYPVLSKNTSPKFIKKQPQPAKKTGKDNKTDNPNKAKEKKTLTNEEKDRIYAVLGEKLAMEGEYPMAMISKILLDGNINYKAYGYSKLKNLLLALPYIRLREVVINGVPQSMVTIIKKEKKKPVLNKKQNAAKPVNNKNSNNSNNNNNSKKNKKNNNQNSKIPDNKKASPSKKESKPILPIENGELTLKDFEIPDKLILSLMDLSGLGIDNTSYRDLILEDLNSAIKSKTLKKREDAYLFPLSLKTKDGERLLGSFKVAGKNCSYNFYLNFVGTDEEKPGDVFKSQIYFQDFDEAVLDLAVLARKEKWCYRHSKDNYIILKIYLQYTYYRLVSQNKVCVDKNSSYAAFNTGLVTDNFEDIYAVLVKNNDPSIEETFIFQGFTISGNQGLGKVIVEHFSPLPLKATYVEKPEDIYFDPKRPIHNDYTHILFDNLSRFPLSFLKNMTQAFPEQRKLISQIENEKSEFQLERLYKNLENSIQKNTVLSNIVKACFDLAVDRAVKLATLDYRSALPSFFPTRNVMSIMLPLVFDDSQKAQAVLLLEATASGNYQGQTILTLKQCYVNARLIGPVTYTFLHAEEIED